MCGIVGVVHSDKRQTVKVSWLRGLTDTMTHRGPDDEGVYVQGPVGLGHRRLSIIDLEGGHQPMFNEDGTVAVVFNGEIYNYAGLQEELTRRGHVFKTRSDTETIVHAYEEYGPECVRKFRGMFAFALWDAGRRRLMLARDRVGKKPLYLYKDERGLLFASEIRALLKSGWVDPKVNKTALDFYLTLGYVPGPETLFQGVTKLPPAHYLLLEDGKTTLKEYWQLEQISPSSLSLEEATQSLAERLRESVRMRLVSDVPLGVFLSGGLDSSAIVACMSELGHTPIKTFSVGYDDAEDISELNTARLVADRFKTDHHEFRLEPLAFLDSLDKLLEHTEEPIIEASGVCLYQLSTMAKAHVTVVLSGEGGDELFAGYGIYARMERIARLHAWLGIAPLRAVSSAASVLRAPEKIQKYLDWLAAPAHGRYHTVSCDVTATVRKRLYTRKFREASDGRLETYFTSLYGKKQGSALDRMLYMDTKTWLTDDLLLKGDKMTMAASVEARCPFLDHELIEFAASLPDAYKLNKTTGKVILRRAMDSRLPQAVLSGPKKGFPLPLKQWFRGTLAQPVRDLLLSDRSLARGYVRPEYVRNMLSAHKSGWEDYSRRIFSLLILELWHRKYIDR